MAQHRVSASALVPAPARQVTISTETKVRDGVLGVLEGWLTTQLLRPICLKELGQLAALAAK